MECKYRLYQVNHHFLNIKIYPEWNVNDVTENQTEEIVKLKSTQSGM